MKVYVFFTARAANRLKESIYHLGHEAQCVGSAVVTTEEIYDDVKAAYHIAVEDRPIVIAEVEEHNPYGIGKA